MTKSAYIVSCIVFITSIPIRFLTSSLQGFSFSLRCCIDLEDLKLIYWGFFFSTSINTIFKFWEPSKHEHRIRSIELCCVPSTAVNMCVQVILKEHVYSILFQTVYQSYGAVCLKMNGSQFQKLQWDVWWNPHSESTSQKTTGQIPENRTM